jgi:hypothetical protein
MSNLLFNLQINNKLKIKILEEVNKDLEYMILDSLNYIETYISSQFIAGDGFYGDTNSVIQTCWKLLTQNTHYPSEMIFLFMLKDLKSKLSESLPIEHYHNYPNSSKSINLAILNQCKEEAEKELELLEYFLTDALADTILIESTLKYKDEQKINFLEGTYRILNSFSKFEDNEDFIKLVTHFNTLVHNKPKTLVKKIIKSKLNYFYCNKVYGLSYFHIVNIIYAVYNILDILKNKKSITDNLKNILHELDDNEGNFLISNLIRDLSEFKNHVNHNQVLQYVSIYYHKNMLFDSVDFNDFKKFIALIFDKDPNKLFLNPLNIEKINRPFNFLYYPRWEISINSESPHVGHVWQFCKEKEDTK